LKWLEESDRSLIAITDVSRGAFQLTRAGMAKRLGAANRQFDIALLLMALSISLASFTLVYVIVRIIRPLRVIIGAMQSVAGSDLGHPIPFLKRRDEIGQLARS